MVPTARATQLTMNREGIRRLAAEELDLPTSPYHFADTYEDYAKAVADVGYPCVVKPVMSSSGKGQSLLRSDADLQKSWDYAGEGGRAGKGRVIVEGFIDFEYEITLLTVRHVGGTTFLEPVGHRQRRVTTRVVAAAGHEPEGTGRVAAGGQGGHRCPGGRGLFGVELFVKGDQVWFSEVSPRPHDTGLVTLISQTCRSLPCMPVPFLACRFRPCASSARRRRR